MIYDKQIWGFATAELDHETLEASVTFPAAMNGKRSARALLLDHLFVLMTRRGANKVTCIAQLGQLEIMNSVMFTAPTQTISSGGDIEFCRYSDRFMENTFAKLRLNAPSTSRGNLQRALLKIYQQDWVR